MGAGDKEAAKYYTKYLLRISFVVSILWNLALLLISPLFLYGFALSLLKNPHDAEDVLQDAYLAVWNGAPGYRSQGKPMAWLLTIVRNLCLQKLRERQRQSYLPQESWEPWLRDKEGMTAEDKAVLAECMARLTDEERHIVVLHAVGGLRHRETAVLLGLPLSTVLSKYARALKKLKDHL